MNKLIFKKNNEVIDLCNERIEYLNSLSIKKFRAKLNQINYYFSIAERLVRDNLAMFRSEQ